jgi:hypothetical protein
LQFSDEDSAFSSEARSSSLLDNIDAQTVTYRRDAKLGMWLPARMNEEYQGAIPRINNPPILGLARSTATYSEYKRFNTSAAVMTPKK